MIYQQSNMPISTLTDMPTVREEELRYALFKGPEHGVLLRKYRDPRNKEKAGRTVVWIGTAVKNEKFQKNCPMLCELYSAYRAASKSFVFMVTWKEGIWLHCDLRALLHSLKPDGTYATYKKSKLEGAGPDPKIVLFGHQLRGATDVVYAVGVPGATSVSGAFDGPRVDPRTPGLRTMTVRREASQVTRASTGLHGGTETAKVDSPGHLEFETIPFDDMGTPRVMHSAFGAGPGQFSFAVLASVWLTKEEELVKKLRLLRLSEPMWSAGATEGDGEVPIDDAWLHSGGPYQVLAGTFQFANNNSLTADEHAQLACGDQDLADIGCITVDKRTGVYKTHTAEEWAARSMGGASAEEWGDVIKTVAAARGKQTGRPIESVEVKDAKVEAKLEKLNALWPLWTVSIYQRAEGGTVSTYKHHLLGAKMTYPKALIASKKAKGV